MLLTFDSIAGLPQEEAERFLKLVDNYNTHSFKNDKKNKYYEGNISLNDVNLGIALPEGLKNLEIGCAWGAKAVDVLAARSRFDGFVGAEGNEIIDVDRIAVANNLIAEYEKACRDEMKYGCTFATLSKDDEIGCKIRFHSPQTASALWDGEKGRVSCGFAIIDTQPNNEDDSTWMPSLIYYYTDTAVWVMRESYGEWIAEEYPHKMGRPLIEPLIWNATCYKPFGR